MATEDMQIKLVLDAVNGLSPKVDQAVRDLDKLSKGMRQAEQASRQSQLARTGSLFDTRTWDAMLKNQEIFQQRMDKLQRTGMNNIIGGGLMLAPVIATVKAAGDMEDIMNQIKIDTYDSSQSAEEWARRVELLRGTSVGLSREVKYSAKDIGEAVDSLVRGNVEVQEVANGAARAAVYLAQASKGEITPGQSAESVAKIGNAWQLSGKQMEETADILARVDAASTASIPDLIEGFKYVASTASNLKLQVKETAIALGVLNNAGLDGSTAGTTLNQMLQHLQPSTKEAKEMFDQLHLSVEKNPFFDANGRLKPMVEIIKIMRNATKDLTDQQKQAAFSKVFDERGSRAMINLLKEGKNSYEDIEGSLDRQMSLWDRIKVQNQALNSQVEILKTNITTLLSDSGSPLAQGLTDKVKALNDAVVGLNEWSKQHPTLVTVGLDTLALVATTRIAIGAIQLLIGKTATTGIGKWLVEGLVGAAESGALSSVAVSIGTGLGTGLGLTALVYGLKWAADHGNKTIDPAVNKALLGKDTDQLKQINANDEATMKRLFDSGAYYRDSEGFVHVNRDKLRELQAQGGGSPVTQTNIINIYPRDAQEAAREIGRYVNGPTKYVQSRMPVPD